MQPSTVYCDTCGAANRPQARFCIACGQAMAAASSLPPTVQAVPVVSSTPPTVLASSTSSSSSPTGLLPANSLLNQRYRILRQLGQGGMGAVYQAEDTRLGDHLVAVKEMSQSELKSQQAITEATQAFRSEAIMLARLRHPHLPRIYDHFAEGGRWYLVMDIIEGETLEDHLVKAGGKLPVEEVLDIGIQLATVLSYLHSHQPPIIFRDLKPANVMRTPDSDLFLIDFGIARHFKPGQAKDTAAYGSMGYAPPEQYGKAQTTPQSDIYSLGATLHHLLSGNDPSQSPFRFAPLSDASIPAGLRTVIAQMVEMDTDKRPASMAEVKQQLQRIAAQPAASQLPPTVYVGGSSLPPTQLAVNPPPAHQLSFVSPASPQSPADQQPLGRLTPMKMPSLGGSVAEGTIVAWLKKEGDWVEKDEALAEIRTDKVNVELSSPVAGRLTKILVQTDQTVPVGADIALIEENAGGSPLPPTKLAVNPPPPSIRLSLYSPASPPIGTTLCTYHGHSDDVYAVAWSPDGARIASASYDHTVQVWDAATGKTLYTYRGHSHWLESVAWSPDGRRIASGSKDKTVQVWQAPLT